MTEIDKAAQQALDYIRSTADYKMGSPAACEAAHDLQESLEAALVKGESATHVPEYESLASKLEIEFTKTNNWLFKESASKIRSLHHCWVYEAQEREALAEALKAALVQWEPWRPIETAPKDGVHVLICKATDADDTPISESFGLFVHRAAWWDEEGWIVYNSNVQEQSPFFEPTHWMPIPINPLLRTAPPAQTPLPRLTTLSSMLLFKYGYDADDDHMLAMLREIESAVRKQFGVTDD